MEPRRSAAEHLGPVLGPGDPGDPAPSAAGPSGSAMQQLRLAYSRLCKEGGAEPQEAVLQRLQELPRGRLDLAAQSLTVDTCRALGKLLPKDALLTEVILSDCMLSEEGGHPGLRGAAGVATIATGELGLGSRPLPGSARPGALRGVRVPRQPLAESCSLPPDLVFVRGLLLFLKILFV